MSVENRKYLRLDQTAGLYPFVVRAAKPGIQAARLLVTDISLDGIGLSNRGYPVIPGDIFSISSFDCTSPIGRMLDKRKFEVKWSSAGKSGGVLDTPLASCQEDFFKIISMSTGRILPISELRRLARCMEKD